MIQTEEMNELLRPHPLPWSIGECHECMAVIVDANEVEVCIIKNGPWCQTTLIADILIEAINGKA